MRRREAFLSEQHEPLLARLRRAVAEIVTVPTAQPLYAEDAMLPLRPERRVRRGAVVVAALVVVATLLFVMAVVARTAARDAQRQIVSGRACLTTHMPYDRVRHAPVDVASDNPERARAIANNFGDALRQQLRALQGRHPGTLAAGATVLCMPLAALAVQGRRTEADAWDAGAAGETLMLNPVARRVSAHARAYRQTTLACPDGRVEERAAEADVCYTDGDTLRTECAHVAGALAADVLLWLDVFAGTYRACT